MSIRPLNPSLASKAALELNEDPSRTPSDLQTIREWLVKEPHLANVKISDQRILSFLRGCKFSIERCKQKLDMYYTMKNLAPELFANRDPLDPKTQAILKSGVTLPFLGLADDGADRVYMVRLGIYDSSKYTLADVLKVSFMITDILLQEDDNFVVSGQMLLLDLKNVSFGVLSQFTPALAKKVTTCSEKTYPIRQKGNHILNTPPGFETGFNLFKSLLSDKLKSRVRVHNQDMNSLHQCIPKRLLPSDMGGDAISTEELIDHWKKKVESYRDWFLEEETYKSDERKRLGKPKTAEIFGVEGSFRKLDID
ncbi:retinol-binding protein pinta-like [Arctopsyche grandis]|uniref:retinol-binding protein pinta-like n=1 Tax=Arctopsyche grandis TaxID=121162 RepID=UPI00406D6CC2